MQHPDAHQNLLKENPVPNSKVALNDVHVKNPPLQLEPNRIYSASEEPFILKEMKYTFTEEIQNMMHTFGDSKTSHPESVQLMEKVLREQMNLLLIKATGISNFRGGKEIAHGDVLFLLRKSKVKLKRLLSYLEVMDIRAYLFKRPMHCSEKGKDLRKLILRKKGSRVKTCVDFLKSIDESFQLTNIMLENIQDPVQLRRMKIRDAMTSRMSKEDYMEFSKKLESSLNSKNGFAKFSTWLMTDNVTRLRPTVLALEIIIYLARETVAEVIEMAFLVKKEQNPDLTGFCKLPSCKCPTNENKDLQDSAVCKVLPEATSCKRKRMEKDEGPARKITALEVSSQSGYANESLEYGSQDVSFQKVSNVSASKEKEDFIFKNDTNSQFCKEQIDAINELMNEIRKKKQKNTQQKNLKKYRDDDNSSNDILYQKSSVRESCTMSNPYTQTADCASDNVFSNEKASDVKDSDVNSEVSGNKISDKNDDKISSEKSSDFSVDENSSGYKAASESESHSGDIDTSECQGHADDETSPVLNVVKEKIPIVIPEGNASEYTILPKKLNSSKLYGNSRFTQTLLNKKVLDEDISDPINTSNSIEHSLPKLFKSNTVACSRNNASSSHHSKCRRVLESSKSSLKHISGAFLDFYLYASEEQKASNESLQQENEDIQNYVELLENNPITPSEIKETLRRFLMPVRLFEMKKRNRRLSETPLFCCS